jgi:hypothetical protein
MLVFKQLFTFLKRAFALEQSILFLAANLDFEPT